MKSVEILMSPVPTFLNFSVQSCDVHVVHMTLQSHTLIWVWEGSFSINGNPSLAFPKTSLELMKNLKMFVNGAKSLDNCQNN